MEMSNFYYMLYYCEQRKDKISIELYNNYMNSNYTKKELLMIFNNFMIKGFQNKNKKDLITFLFNQKIKLINKFN